MRIRASMSFADAIRHPAAFLTGDASNIARLADKLGCSLADADAVYRLARRTGYASAYQTVFEGRQAPGQVRTSPALKPAPTSGVAPRAHRVRAAGGRPA